MDYRDYSTGLWVIIGAAREADTSHHLGTGMLFFLIYERRANKQVQAGFKIATWIAQNTPYSPDV